MRIDPIKIQYGLYIIGSLAFMGGSLIGLYLHMNK